MLSRNSRKSLSVLAVTAVLVACAAPAYAESEGEKSITGFFRRLFNYPGKAVKGTAGMTSNTLNNTGEKVVSKAGENTAAVLQGDLAKTGNLASDAVTGTANTLGQAAAETVAVPVQSAEEDPAA